MAFNLEEENRGGYVVSREMKHVWQVQMELLQRLLDVCQAYGLRVWVDGGTLLGTVRHHGYIPWDDDIDVCMMRPDYDRLLEVAGEEFREPYFFQTAYTDVDYYRAHAQLRDSRTTGVRPSECFNPYHQGIFIDIFPMDGVPATEEGRRRTLHTSRRIQRFLKTKNLHLLASGRLTLVFRKLKCLWQVRTRGWEAIFRPCEEMFRETPVAEASHVAEICFSGYDFVIDKHIFDETLWLDFEDMKVPVPARYDELLRIQYGDDYMRPRRIPTYHGEVIFDTEHSYVERLPEIRRQYRFSVLKRGWEKIMSKRGT